MHMRIGPQLGPVVERITCHVDETAGFIGSSRARQCIDMPKRMAWCVEQVETAVAEVIEGAQVADFEVRILEGKFYYVATGEVGRQNGGVGLLWKPWRVGRLDTRADNEVDAGRECRRISNVIPVSMAPDDRFDGRWFDTVVLKDLGDILRYFNITAPFSDPLDDHRMQIGPVLANSEVEENPASVASVWVTMGNEEAVGASIEFLEARKRWLHENDSWNSTNSRSGVDD